MKNTRSISIVSHYPDGDYFKKTGKIPEIPHHPPLGRGGGTPPEKLLAGGHNPSYFPKGLSGGRYYRIVPAEWRFPDCPQVEKKLSPVTDTQAGPGGIVAYTGTLFSSTSFEMT
jgi:hypothetical protein